MSILSAGNPRDTAVAWLFVAVQFVLLILIVVLPAGDAWTNPTWLVHAATALQWLGVAVLVVGLVNLGRSLTPLPSPSRTVSSAPAGCTGWYATPSTAGSWP